MRQSQQIGVSRRSCRGSIVWTSEKVAAHGSKTRHGWLAFFLFITLKLISDLVTENLKCTKVGCGGNRS